MNIEALADKYPKNKRALRKLALLLEQHRLGSVITAKELARNIPVDAKALSDALAVLINAGVIRQVYKVTTPSGSLTEDEFDDPREIPDQLPDMWEHYFDTAESDIVPVFKRVA
jgi:hypothetical protein